MPTSVRKERLPELDLFRAFAILGVIHVHASSYAAAGQAADSPYYYLINLMNIFFKFGTPCFIFLSSFVLFYNYFDTPVNRELVSRFFKRRLLYIIVPYIVASVCYYIVNHKLNIPEHYSLSEHLAKLAKGIATGTAYTHLYFVFINLQFYVLFPFVLWLFQRFRRLVVWAVPIGLAIEWGFVLWNKYVLVLPNKGSYAPTYMSYYMLGMFLAIYFEPLRAWLTEGFRSQSAKLKTATVALWLGWLAAALTHVQLYHNGRAYSRWVNSLWYEAFWNVHTLLSALVLLQAAFWVYRRVPAALAAFLARLGALSFSIYLLHPAFLMIYRRFRYTLAPESFGYLVWIWAGVPICLLLSWAVAAFTFRWIPGSSYLLGSKPKLPARPSGQPASPAVGS